MVRTYDKESLYLRMRRSFAKAFCDSYFHYSCLDSIHSHIQISAIDRTHRDYLSHQSLPHPSYFNEYFSPTPLLTAGRSAILSIHFNRCGNGSISSFVNPVFSHPLTHGQVPISATLYLPLPLPARYSRGEPVYLPERWISRTP